MTDRPIIFSGPMVLAMLDERKTQTRRLLKPQPQECVTSAGVHSNSIEGHTNRWSWLSGDPRDIDTWGFEGDFRAPAAIGDRLYVREAWRASYDTDWYLEELGRPPKPTEFDPTTTAIEYLADGTKELGGKDRPSIHMPRWASRLTLVVEDVRVERLQEISEADAIAEGIIQYEPTEEDPAEFSWVDGGDIWNNAKPAYGALWNSLHTDAGERWDDNPWVVAITFSVLRGNVDQVPL